MKASKLPPPPPQIPEQERLGKVVKATEKRREAAAAAYKKDKTVAAELELMQLELEVAVAWSAYHRATADHIDAIKYSDQAQKLAGRIAALRELVVSDLLVEVSARVRRESEIARRVGGR